MLLVFPSNTLYIYNVYAKKNRSIIQYPEGNSINARKNSPLFIIKNISTSFIPQKQIKETNLIFNYLQLSRFRVLFSYKTSLFTHHIVIYYKQTTLHPLIYLYNCNIYLVNCMCWLRIYIFVVAPLSTSAAYFHYME